MIRLTVFNTPDDIAVHTYGLLAQTAKAEVKASAALSFGSTYEGIFRKWKDLWLSGAGSELPPGRTLPAFFPADERRVGFDHPGSNWGTAWKNFMSECGSSEDRERWASDPERYGDFIKSFFGTASELPIFNMIFLGLGPDGHTASLFPGDCPEEGEPDWTKLVLETTAPFDPPPRLTLGPEVIASAKRLILTVTGASKAEIFEKFLGELAYKDDGKSLRGLLPPARIIRRRSAIGLDTQIICDAAASAGIEKSATNRKGWIYEIQTDR